MNRFQSREGAGPRFEKRWADRKSSLKTLEGFRFFTLLRRADNIELNGKTVEYEEDTPDYMSMTVWETKKNFNSWRTGYAFKEAHGGGMADVRAAVACAGGGGAPCHAPLIFPVVKASCAACA
jgi:heme-degrading monooxygenase HmoA